MKQQLRTLALVVMVLCATGLMAQDGNVKTIFKGGLHSSGGYGAASNKFTKIRGKYANISELYGGWFINHRFMVGLSLAGTTNNLRVPTEFSSDPSESRTWQYGQFGVMTEYVIGSGKPVHLVAQLFSGAGFTMQYKRFGNTHGEDGDVTDQNWFVVAEPGVQLEFNLFKWMRFSPGVSYRAAFGSDGRGLKDKDLSAVSYNATLKFGRF